MNLNQITLPGIDIQKSVNFYKRMGFNQIVASEDYARFESLAGDATFSIHKVDSLAENNNIIIYFEVDSVESTVSELEARGFVFNQRPTAQDWLWTEAYLSDPGGNTICIYHAGVNRKNPPWRLN